MLDRMNTNRRFSPLVLSAVFLLTLSGCDGDSATRSGAKEQSKSVKREAPKEQPKQDEAKKVLMGPNVWLEVDGKTRRVLISAVVCLGTFKLEQLLCRTGTKEHEAILTADVDARNIHKALLATGAEPGSPVRYEPKYQPATGTRIKVSIRYRDKDNQLQNIPARQWIRNLETKKDLDKDWVFAGSQLIPNEEEPNMPHYLANDGSVICIANSETALLDLPINSPKSKELLLFELAKEKIPPIETKVVVVLEPLLEK